MVVGLAFVKYFLPDYGWIKPFYSSKEGPIG
jgi:hypothetical protein